MALGPHPVAVSHSGPIGPHGPSEQKKAGPRFRSFVERYVIERAAYFRKDPEGLVEDQWQCILDGKRLYAMINRVGQGAAMEGLDE